MNEFRINSRVKHRVFGLGTVINMSERFLMVLFDDGETRRFISDALYAMAFSDIQVEKSSEKIKIQRIFIKNLFERLDYDIVINNTNSVAILSAPNGCGKTTIFKILTFVLNPEMNIFSEIKSVPFSIFSCYLSNGKTVSLQRESLKPQDNNAKKGHNISVYDIAMSIFSEPFDWVFKISEEQKELVSVSLAQTIYEYRNGGNSSSYRDDVGEYEEPVYGTRRSLSIVNRWFYVINASLRKHNCIVFIDFIEANRLQKNTIQ